MSAGSGIEWTDATWNPVTGCTRVSAGCDHCYAVPMTRRLEGAAKGAIGNGQLRRHGQKYVGLTVRNAKGEWHFNGKVRCHDDALGIPLRWKRSRRIFVNSMSDLFHRDVPDEFILDVLLVCGASGCGGDWHTMQILTKRPERAAELLAKLNDEDARHYAFGRAFKRVEKHIDEPNRHWLSDYAMDTWWPIDNVWLGTSVENQDSASKRIPDLLRCPAAVRFLSVEPLIGPVDLKPWLWEKSGSTCRHETRTSLGMPAIDWVIVGGESGHGARPCNIEWIRSIVAQCRAAEVPCFVKQFGSRPYDPSWHGDGTYPGSAMQLDDPKGGNWDEWPEDLRVREFPKTSVPA